MDAAQSVDVEVGNVIDLWARVPLAEAALSIWRFVFDEQRLEQVWERRRGRCYEKVISFATMTHLMADALLQYSGSGRRSFEKNIESGQLNSSVAAAFGKLGRLPLEVSQTLLLEGTAALRELFPRDRLRQLPASLSAFEAIVIDGKAIKRVAKRLKPLRGVGGGLLGGKAVVAMEWSSGLAVAMQTHPDGDASEKRLVKELVLQTDTLTTKPRLFVADRGFCDLVQAAHFTARPGDHFVVRHHSGTTFTPDPSRPEQTGTDSQGRPYVQTWGWLGSASNKGRRYTRRIHLSRPGEEDLILITDLLDAEVYPATDLLELYRQRWGIEQMFQKVTEVFSLNRLIGGTPQACIFQFAFCMLLYNIVQLLTSYIAKGQRCEADEISQEKLFDDVHRQLVAWNVIFTLKQTNERFETSLTASQMKKRLRQILADVWSDTWRKCPKQKNRRQTQREAKRGHSTVYRLLQAHANTRPTAKPTTQRC
jgi:DDE family transposase